MPRPAIQVENVTVRYHRHFEPAITDLTFTIEPATIAMIIGPNGSGKTTLIKAMLGLIPYEGNIKINGRDVAACEHAIGYVPQNHSIDLSFPMTVAEFLHFSHTNCPDYVNRPAHIHKTLALIGADHLKNQAIKTLSGGQLQRVLLARALMHQPRILILDEPEAGIDVGGEQTLYDLLVMLKKEHQLTSLVATHEIDLVHHYADHVLCLNQKLIASGKPAEVINQPTLMALYGRHIEDRYV
jgi:zinc transport system ATP-binding protein